MVDLTNPIFHDPNKAREWLESERWPSGPVCPRCGTINEATKLKGKSTRPGVYKCRPCDKPFTVTVGTVFEDSKVPLHKWLLATFLVTSSKKGISSHQIHRTLGVSYKTAWFMTQRIRAAMTPDPSTASPIGGAGKVVESDETFIGGKAKNVHRGKPTPKKHPVQALVERGGQVRAQHIADVTAKTLRRTIAKHVAKGTTMNTDDALAYYHMSKEFAAHGVVNHSKDEYVSKDGTVHIQSAESFFAILKRQMYGTHHAVSEQHLHRYVSEAAFKWNHRSALGVEDTERAAAAIRGIGGKRLTYRPVDQASHS
ncbi:MAG: IS1595 family transposase [Hyphomicrobiaceae bacterium]|nr:IS1595 family transposase [Hyphomicrobiaceae bacterium]